MVMKSTRHPDGLGSGGGGGGVHVGIQVKAKIKAGTNKIKLLWIFLRSIHKTLMFCCYILHAGFFRGLTARTYQ